MSLPAQARKEGIFEGKNILVGVSGGIAVYKSAALVSALVKAGALVDVVMTANATQFVAPLTFSTLTGRPVAVDTFQRGEQYEVEHISWAQRAQLAIVAPATANILAKMACGLADDMLTTTFLAARCPKLIAPAMNTGMWENIATQENLEILRRRGMVLVEPQSGPLACGDIGVGRMAPSEEILEAMEPLLSPQAMARHRVLVTAGATQESLDPVRYLTNHSTGRMGYELARAARNQGAKVILITGITSLQPPLGVEVVTVTTAAEMFQAVQKKLTEVDIIVKAAAVADYTPVHVSKEKIKKTGTSLVFQMERTQDILAWVGTHKVPGQVAVGFAMETENLLENARKKLVDKQVDLMVANSLRDPGAGFGGDTNQVTLISAQDCRKLPLLSKYETSLRVWEAALALLEAKVGDNKG